MPAPDALPPGRSQSNASLLSRVFNPTAEVEGLGRFRALRAFWKAAPVPAPIRALATGLVYRLSGRARAMIDAEAEIAEHADLRPRPANAIPRGRLVVSGYLAATSGIGRGGRLSVAGFRAAGLEPLLHDLENQSDGWGVTEPGGVWFCHCNAVEGADFLMRVEGPRNCYRVAYWAWELPNLPPAWIEAARLFHEIWTPSRFVLDAVRRSLPDESRPKLRLVPHPLPDLSEAKPDRSRYGLSDDQFAFLCMYDVHSSATRKNPMGAIAAFQMAFAPERRDVALLVKVVAAADSISCLAELEAAIGGWPNIRLITEMLSDAEADRLIATADAFVSLHRSEGFGLSIAQAMALGRPVIVTAWSGNMDYCDEGAALVDYELIPLKDPHGVYAAFEAPEQVWAEPELASAAAAMRRFADAPQAALALGAKGREHVRKRLPGDYTLPAFMLAPWLRNTPWLLD